MRTVFLQAILCVLSCTSHAQISGTVFFKKEGITEKLAGANVLLIDPDDKVLAKVLTDKHGDFLFQLPPPGIYRVVVSYLGLKTMQTKVKVIKQTADIILSPFVLEPLAISLTTVDIKSVKPVAIITGDTATYSAHDFQTAENASIKNLLQKIPGLNLGSDGSFYYHGRKIKDLSIDGRSLLQEASKDNENQLSEILQASLVDKIQLSAKKGLDGKIPEGVQETAINIVTRKEVRKQVNGSLGVGYGDQQRYNVAANESWFAEHGQVILSGNANNISSFRPPSSVDETSMMSDYLPGITKRHNLNGNLSFDLSKKVKLTTNFQHQQNDIENSQTAQRVNILPAGRSTYTSRSIGKNNFNGNSLFLNLEYKPDKWNVLSIYAHEMTFKGKSLNTSRYSTLDATTLDTINYGQLINTELKKNNKLYLSAQYFRLFKKVGRFLNASISADNSLSNSQQVNYSINSGSFLTDTVNQAVTPKEHSFNVTLNMGYHEPLNKSLSLNAAYNISNIRTRSELLTLDYNPIEQAFDRKNDSLSYRFRNNNRIQSFSAGLTFYRGKIEATLTGIYNMNLSNSYNMIPMQRDKQALDYFAPSLNVSYKINQNQRLNLTFNSSSMMPDRATLMPPVVSAKNPLYVQLGNPDLAPGVNRFLNLDYSSLWADGLTLNANFSGTLQQQGLSTSIVFDSSGKQTSTPLNVNGNYFLMANLSIGKRFGQITLNYNTMGTISRSNSYINGIQNKATLYRINQLLNANWSYKKLLEINSILNVEYSGSRYQNTVSSYLDYLSYKLYTSINAYLPLGINIGTAANYNENTSKDYTVINCWISTTMLPKKKLQLKAYVYDLFKQNQSIRVQQATTFTEQTETVLLGRYFMASATYFFGKK